ncbi:hypothetical protein V6N12_023989 [Hibiscus sabdariffa]|uniref:Uncharacterized protein n=1 Tax=Hibiscus sabdariffa TaxID=183260 RepID=A0ABR2FZB8_9ROSI
MKINLGEIVQRLVREIAQEAVSLSVNIIKLDPETLKRSEIQDCYEFQGMDTMNPMLIIDEKVKLLSEELLSAREEARVACEKLAYSESGKRNNGDCGFAVELSKEIEDLISEAQE